jgi:hypothetical protein
VSPQNCNPNITLKKKPSEYLNQLYFDAMVFTPEGLRHLVAQVGASQVVLGTDHPIPWEEHPVDHVFATTTLTDKQRVAILGGNARVCSGSSKPDRAVLIRNRNAWQPARPSGAHRCTRATPGVSGQLAMSAGSFRSCGAFVSANRPSADLAAFENRPTAARPQTPRTLLPPLR